MDEQYFLANQRINVESESQEKRLNLGFDLANSFHEKKQCRNVLPSEPWQKPIMKSICDVSCNKSMRQLSLEESPEPEDDESVEGVREEVEENQATVGHGRGELAKQLVEESNKGSKKDRQQEKQQLAAWMGGVPADGLESKHSPSTASPAAALPPPTNPSKPASPSAKQTEDPGVAILTDIRWISSPEPPKLTAGSKSSQLSPTEQKQQQVEDEEKSDFARPRPPANLLTTPLRKRHANYERNPDKTPVPAGEESGGSSSKVEEPQKPKPSGSGKCHQLKTSIGRIMRAIFKRGGKKHEEKQQQARKMNQAEKKLEIKPEPWQKPMMMSMSDVSCNKSMQQLMKESNKVSKKDRHQEQQQSSDWFKKGTPSDGDARISTTATAQTTIKKDRGRRGGVRDAQILEPTLDQIVQKFGGTVLNKEGIEKILSTLMPSLEEIERVREAQGEQPDAPLGQAEQFLLSLSEIDCMLERLRDYQNVEKDVAEALMEWNNAMKEIEELNTFQVAMGMMLTIGNALNGTDIKAFQLDNLARASEVKDPIHKYPLTLTHHLAECMLGHCPEGTDLYSELGAVSRSSLDPDEEEEPKPMKAAPPMILTSIFLPTDKKSMEFPEPEPVKEPIPPLPESEKPKKKLIEDDDAGGGGFAAMLARRANKMQSGEGSSTLRKMAEQKASESDERKWKEVGEKLKEKPMIIRDLDSSEEFDQDSLVLARMAQMVQDKGLLIGGCADAAPSGIISPPPPGLSAPGAHVSREPSPGPSSKSAVVKLQWKEAQHEAPPVPALKRKGTFWSKVQLPQIDTSKLARLFEQKPKEVAVKRPGTEAKPQLLNVLSVKPSQPINIGLTDDEKEAAERAAERAELNEQFLRNLEWDDGDEEQKERKDRIANFFDELCSYCAGIYGDVACYDAMDLTLIRNRRHNGALKNIADFILKKFHEWQHLPGSPPEIGVPFMTYHDNTTWVVCIEWAETMTNCYACTFPPTTDEQHGWRIIRILVAQKFFRNGRFLGFHPAINVIASVAHELGHTIETIFYPPRQHTNCSRKPGELWGHCCLMHDHSGPFLPICRLFSNQTGILLTAFGGVFLNKPAYQSYWIRVMGCELGLIGINEDSKGSPTNLDFAEIEKKRKQEMTRVGWGCAHSDGTNGCQGQKTSENVQLESTSSESPQSTTNSCPKPFAGTSEHHHFCTDKRASSEQRRRISTEIMSVLEREQLWDFDVIELERVTDHQPLSSLGQKVFERWNVCEALHCAPEVLHKWLAVIEANYQSGNAYHNATHAAAVLQATSYFLNSDPKLIEDDDAGGGGFAAMLARRANKMQSGEGSSTLRKMAEQKASESDERKWKEVGEKLKEKPRQQQMSRFLNGHRICAGIPDKPGQNPTNPKTTPGETGAQQNTGNDDWGCAEYGCRWSARNWRVEEAHNGRANDGQGGIISPPPPGLSAPGAHVSREPSPGPSSKSAVVKLQWKEAQHEAPPVPALKRKGTFWSKVQLPQIDTSKLARLFEQKPKEVAVKRPGTEAKPQLLNVLSVKPSQPINIGLTDDEKEAAERAAERAELNEQFLRNLEWDDGDEEQKERKDRIANFFDELCSYCAGIYGDVACYDAMDLTLIRNRRHNGALKNIADFILKKFHEWQHLPGSPPEIGVPFMTYHDNTTWVVCIEWAETMTNCYACTFPPTTDEQHGWRIIRILVAQKFFRNGRFLGFHPAINVIASVAHELGHTIETIFYPPRQHTNCSRKPGELWGHCCLMHDHSGPFLPICRLFSNQTGILLTAFGGVFLNKPAYQSYWIRVMGCELGLIGINEDSKGSPTNLDFAEIEKKRKQEMTRVGWGCAHSGGTNGCQGQKTSENVQLESTSSESPQSTTNSCPKPFAGTSEHHHFCTDKRASSEQRRRISTEIMSVLEREQLWDFDVIELECVTDHQPLSSLGQKVFERWNVCEALHCAPEVLHKWLAVIEANYQSGNAYHNATHAAAVLQATSYFLNSDPKLIEDDDAGGGGFAAMLARRANKMQSGEGSSTLRKMAEQKASESDERKWKEVGEKLKEKPRQQQMSRFLNGHRVCARIPDKPGQNPTNPKTTPGETGAQQNTGNDDWGCAEYGCRWSARNWRVEEAHNGRANDGQGGIISPPPPGLSAPGAHVSREPSPGPSSKSAVVKLQWKEAQHEAPPVPALKRKGTFWSKVQLPQIDTSKLARLFEQKPKEVAVKSAELAQSNESNWQS